MSEIGFIVRNAKVQFIVSKKKRKQRSVLFPVGGGGWGGGAVKLLWIRWIPSVKKFNAALNSYGAHLTSPPLFVYARNVLQKISARVPSSCAFFTCISDHFWRREIVVDVSLLPSSVPSPHTIHECRHSKEGPSPQQGRWTMCPKCGDAQSATQFSSKQFPTPSNYQISQKPSLISVHLSTKILHRNISANRKK